MFRLSSKLPAALAAALSLLLAGCLRDDHAEHPAVARLPANIAWAWERPEDLTWLPSDAGVAYVAMAVVLDGERADLRPRAYPLKVRGDTVLIPVVHVDASYRRPPSLSVYQRDAIVAQLLKLAASTQAPVVQLDFEVRRSQRAFLQDVVAAARRGLPQAQALSITALASWCAGDFWLADVQADEIVPMVFRMANDEQAIRALLDAHQQFPRRRCQSAVGFSTDERMPAVVAKRRYYFSPAAWTRADWQALKH
jgi:hypothetical protein